MTKLLEPLALGGSERNNSLGKDYEAGTIAHKLYSADSLPDDDGVLDDLDVVLQAYDQYLENPDNAADVEEPTSELGHWLFQANPKYFDIQAALRDMDVMAWTVNPNSASAPVADRGP